MFKYFEKRKAEKERKEQWLKDKERLAQFEADLSKLGDFPKGDEVEALEYAVRFFNIVSEFRDNGSINSAPEELEEIASKFNTHIRNASRNGVITESQVEQFVFSYLPRMKACCFHLLQD
ncbi:hypothetical protein FWH09_01775 [Candidatus Saccharibacteria bacterium]|nr:hypothetical protein [Candidatus Saccharibacteria bacterium]